MAEPVNTPSNGHWYPPPAKSDADLTKDVKKNIAKNTTNVPPSTSVQNCPLANKPAPKNDPNNKVCNFTAVKVTKPERKFDLIVSRSTNATQRTIGIVAGFKNKPAKVSVELKGPAGPCPETHNNKRSFNTGSNTFKILPSSTENKLELDVTSSTRIQLFPWGLATDKYSINANRCGHLSESVTIEVYPDTETDVFIGFNFGEKKGWTDDRVEVEQTPGNRKAARADARNGMGRIKTTTTQEKSTEVKKGVRVGGEIKYDGHEHKVEVVFQKTIETLEKVGKIVDKAKVALSQIKGKKDAAGVTQIFDSPVALGIKLPVVDLHVGGSWQEDSGLPTVTYEGKIKLETNPLIGFFLEWNITTTVLQSLPGGIVFQKIKQRLVDGFLELVLKAGVEIAGEIELVIKNREIENVTGKIKGKIPLAAELTVLRVDTDIWIVHATMEYKVGVESGFEVAISYVSNSKVLNCVGGMLDLSIWWSGMNSFGGAHSDTGHNKYGSHAGYGPEGKHELYKKTFESKYEFFSYDFKKP